MADNTFSNPVLLEDDVALKLGTGGDALLDYDSGNNRVELQNSSATVMRYDTLVAQYGTYSPTGTSVANVASVGAQNAMFSRHSDIVTISGQCVLTPTAGTTATNIRLTLPTNHTSTFSNAYEAAGAGTATEAGVFVACQVFANTANNQLEIAFKSNGTGAHTIYYTAQYKVI